MADTVSPFRSHIHREVAVDLVRAAYHQAADRHVDAIRDGDWYAVGVAIPVAQLWTAVRHDLPDYAEVFAAVLEIAALYDGERTTVWVDDHDEAWFTLHA